MTDPGLVFIGICERAAYVREGNTNLFKWNILGLKQVVLSNIFPLPFQGIPLGFAISAAGITGRHHLQIVDASGKEIGTIDLDFSAKAFSADTNDPVGSNETLMVMLLANGWQAVFLPINAPGFLVERPDVHHIRLQTDLGPQIIGEIHFHAVDPPPLTADRVAAIRSDPNAAKAVRMEFGCKFCPSKCRVYAALERSDSSEADGWSWFETIPEIFTCDCSKTKLDMSLIRRNLHALLGQPSGQGDQVSFVPLYEKSSLESIRTGLARLLKTATKEEQLQQFIQKNPVILHQFPAARLFPKPPILTFFVADFAIVTPQRELLLVELEKPTTTLLEKNDGVAAPLNHAFDQVRDWLHTIDEHRLAVLDSLKISREQVSSVRAVVIAGRDSGYDAQHLRKLKGEDRGRVCFLTYDDLCYYLDVLIGRLHAL